MRQHSQALVPLIVGDFRPPSTSVTVPCGRMAQHLVLIDLFGVRHAVRTSTCIRSTGSPAASVLQQVTRRSARRRLGIVRAANVGAHAQFDTMRFRAMSSPVIASGAKQSLPWCLGTRLPRRFQARLLAMTQAVMPPARSSPAAFSAIVIHRRVGVAGGDARHHRASTTRKPLTPFTLSPSVAHRIHVDAHMAGADRVQVRQAVGADRRLVIVDRSAPKPGKSPRRRAGRSPAAP